MTETMNKTIEKLRKEVKSSSKDLGRKPSVKNVVSLVKDLTTGAPLKQTAAKMPGRNLKEKKDFTLNLITKFGTWLSHAEGSVKTVSVGDEKNLIDLINLTSADPDAVEVRIPSGYAPKSSSDKDVTNAIASIVAHNPESRVIERFVARAYRSRSSELTYPVVASVWMFAKLDRLDNIDLVSSDPVFRKKIVDAYDLLTVSVQDASDALDAIISSDAKQNSQKIVKACIKSKWVHEGFLTDLENSVKAKNYSKADNLIQQISLHKSSLPLDLKSLSAGNIRKICEYAGIPVEHAERVDETHIRSKLKSLGFAKDSDYLLADALKAHQLGKESEFWEIMSLRHEGDSSWVDRLSGLLV